MLHFQFVIYPNTFGQIGEIINENTNLDSLFLLIHIRYNINE